MKKILIVLWVALLFPMLLANAPIIDEVYTWSDLKIETNGKELNAYVERRGQGSKQWVFTFDLGHKKVKFMPDSLPHENNPAMTDFKTDSDVVRKATFKKVGNERLFYYDYQNTASNLPVFADIADGAVLNGFRPHVLFNIDTGDVVGTSKLILHAYLQRQGLAFFFDVLFPMSIENLLQISINYDYRVKTGVWGIGFWGKYKNTTVTRVNGNSVGTLSWWKWATSILGEVAGTGWYDLATTPKKVEHIKELKISDMNEKYKTDYARALNAEREKNKLNKINVDEMFNPNTKLYHVYGNTMNNFLATDFEVKNTSIIEVLYFFKGEYFHVKGDDILTIANELLGRGPNATLALLFFLIIIVVLFAFFGKFGIPALAGIKGVFNILLSPFKLIVNLIKNIGGRKK